MSALICSIKTIQAHYTIPFLVVCLYMTTKGGCTMTDIRKLNNTDGLVDINDISVDKDLPKPERIKEYIRQIKNPYCFKCGNFIVKARYQNAGLSIEDCLQSIII